VSVLDYLKSLKNNFFKKENLYYFFIILIIFFLDRRTKNIIKDKYSENQIYINEYINFDLIWNTGIGFGLLSTETSFVYNLVSFLIGIIILGILFIFLTSDKQDKLIYCLITGGALGNFYDRLVFQAVPDFIDLHYNNFHWFTFNVADIFITIGVIVFVIRSFFVKN
tara:strand:+ start:2200 stop:2700 length:501 start_codon:yes stop_codon:yes gene_type:complete